MIAFRQIENRFSLELNHSNPVMQMLFQALRPGIEWSLALHQLTAIAETAERIDDADSAENKILRALGASCMVNEEALERIPAEGPLVVVANHPFGGVEGLLLASILRRRRSDVRIMANHILGNIRQLRELFILVDPFGNNTSTRANLGAMKETLRWLERGGVLGVFPSGAVSHLDLKRRRVSDPPWNKSIGRLVQASGAAVLPVYFEGQNGPLFQTLGLLHPLFRTARLPYEFVNKRGLQARVHLGPVIPPERLARFKTPGDLISYLRIRTEMQRQEDHVPLPVPRITTLQPVIPGSDTTAIRDEIAALPTDAQLIAHDHFRVFVASAQAVPTVLREIGRLREITFRANNEGTDREIDLDRFDEHYLHLFLWDDDTDAVVAAYRLGQTDRILETHGKDGLYTRTLFDIRKRLLKQISPALEMGRSFVRQEYQKQFLPLMLLWRGIGAYVVRNPRYAYLFGPVSVNSAYSSTSQQLLVEFLRR
ncbi:MAG: lysophospholipid acyltransferase family protein, partial [Bacteroidetes bacterium]|nr:lysophospholipid acyltransferase family protein [Bacteroidota bacterium]